MIPFQVRLCTLVFANNLTQVDVAIASLLLAGICMSFSGVWRLEMARFYWQKWPGFEGFSRLYWPQWLGFMKRTCLVFTAGATLFEVANRCKLDMQVLAPSCQWGPEIGHRQGVHAGLEFLVRWRRRRIDGNLKLQFRTSVRNSMSDRW